MGGATASTAGAAPAAEPTRYDVLSQGAPKGDVGDPDTIPSRNEITTGVWMDAIWKVTDRWEIVPGSRVDYFANDASVVATATGAPGGAAWGIDPRLASRFASRHGSPTSRRSATRTRPRPSPVRFLNKEAVGLRCDESFGTSVDRCRAEEVGPISVPSLGAEGTF
jgi:outer membrane receptor protein involved in Fe transport